MGIPFYFAQEHAWARCPCYKVCLFDLNIDEIELDGGVPVKVIYLRLISNIEKFVFEQLFFKFSESESYTAKRCGIITYHKLEMVAICSHSFWVCGEANTFCCENRLGISLSERAK